MNIREKASSFLSDLSEQFQALLRFPSEELAIWRDYDAFSNLLPYQAYEEEENLFYLQGSVGFAFEITPIYGSDEAFERELENLFEELLSEGDSLQFFLFADHRTKGFLNNWKGSKQGIYRELAEKRAEFFEEKVSARLFRCLISFSREVEGELSYAEKKQLLSTRENIVKVFSQFSAILDFNAEDIINFCDPLCSFKKKDEAKRYSWNPRETLNSQLFSGDKLKVEKDRLIWEGEEDYCLKTFRIANYPDFWSLWQMQGFIGDEEREKLRFDDPFYLHYAVHVPKQEAMQRNLNIKMAAVENQGKSSFVRKYLPGLAKEFDGFARARAKLAKGERVVKSFFSLGIFAPQSEIEDRSYTAKSLFRSQQFKLEENLCLHLVSHLASLPMSWAYYQPALAKLNLLKTTLSGECGNLLPIQSEWQGSGSPAMLLLGRRGQLATWTPFDNAHGNYNAIVVGTSGSGKSFFMQELMLSTLSLGGRCVVIDNGNSFEKLCKLLGGQHIDFGEKQNFCLNPFSLVTKENQENQLVLITRCLCAMASPKGRLSELEEGVIERVVHKVWQEEGQHADVQSVANFLEKSEDKSWSNLAIMLTSFAKDGNYGRYFCGKNNISLSKQAVVVELKALEDKPELRNVVLMMLLMNVYNQIMLGDRKTPYMIIIDEAWALLSGSISSFIDKLSRTLRKYRGSLVIGTQRLSDFIDFPAAEVALSNSDWRCFLRSSEVSDDEAKKLGIERQARSIKQLRTVSGEYSEVLISAKASGGNYLTRLKVDRFASLLYSTNPSEFSKVQELQARGFSLLEAIERVLQS